MKQFNTNEENAMSEVRESVARDCESPGFNVNVALTGAAIEVLHCLFIHGPTWDGDVPSKSGRDELFDLKLIGRCDGYQFLTANGVRLALANGLDRKKSKRRREEFARLQLLDQVEALFVPKNGCAMGMTPKPTVETLERLLQPEDENGRV